MNGYRLLGYVVWRAGKWYLRRRLPSRRVLGGAALALVAGVAASIVLIRRIAG
jgi:hypothetical protein